MCSNPITYVLFNNCDLQLDILFIKITTRLILKNKKQYK